MPKITLRTLGIETDVPIGYLYMDKGEVTSPTLYSWGLSLKYCGFMPTARDVLTEKRPFNVLGKCSRYFPTKENFVLLGPGKKHIYTYIKSGLPEPLRTFVLGHEEGHALDAMLGLGNLDSALKEAGVETPIPVKKWPKFHESVKKIDEAIADVAGLYALLKNKSEDVTNFSTSAWENWKVRVRVQLEPISEKRFRLVPPWEL